MKASIRFTEVHDANPADKPTAGQIVKISLTKLP
jgi:hypothetical protein